MLKNYLLVWLSIATGGSLINTALWWLDELVLTVPNTDFDRSIEHYIGVFIIGFILSFLISFPSLFFIYLVEEWKKAPFTIWLHVSIFVFHVLAVFIFLGFIGLLFLVAVRINKRFLIKTGAFDKTYKELGSDYVKAWKEK